jgi:hypothetical protein
MREYLEYTKRLLAQFNLSRASVELCNDAGPSGVEEGLCIDGWLYIYKEGNLFCAYELYVHPATRTDPEEVEDTVLADLVSFDAALATVLAALIKHEMEYVLRDEAESSTEEGAE